MRVPATIVCVAIGLGAVLGAGQPAALPAAAAKEEVKPALVEFLGADGKITNGEFVRVTDSAAWLELWAKHTGLDKEKLAWSDATPKVDFTRCMVVAYFRGKTVNTRGEELQAAEEGDGTLRLRFRSSGYQSASFSGEDHGVAAVSYGIWVLPRNTKAIVIEEDVQSLIGKPPVWKEQKTFDAIK
jgi:hypothetical protein